MGPGAHWYGRMSRRWPKVNIITVFVAAKLNHTNNLAEHGTFLEFTEPRYACRSKLLLLRDPIGSVTGAGVEGVVVGGLVGMVSNLLGD